MYVCKNLHVPQQTDILFDDVLDPHGEKLDLPLMEEQSTNHSLPLSILKLIGIVNNILSIITNHSKKTTNLRTNLKDNEYSEPPQICHIW